jgi:beta-barrel assembly-enhancing protease
MQRRDFLKWGGSAFLGTGTLAALTGCETMDALSSAGSNLGLGQYLGAQGEAAESLLRVGGAAARAAEDLDPEQEYYLGRTVAANVLTLYRPFEDPVANEYLNTLGNYVRLASGQPETYGGYHFQIIDTEEINALSAPGGLVIISRGMIKCCTSEDALAAVLAHEVGHVEFRHGVQAIKRSRMTTLLTTIGGEAVQHQGNAQVNQIVGLLDGAIDDIIATMVNNGYSRSLEGEADDAALSILHRTGYDDRALIEMLDEMGRRLQPGGKDFAKTHPTPADRIRKVEPGLAKSQVARSSARQARFEQAMRNV